MGFKKPNALFVFLCALAEVLSTQPECGDWFVFLSVFVYVDTPSSLKLQEDVSARPSPSFTHFPSQAFFFFLFILCFVCLFLPPPFFWLSPPTGADCIPARRGRGVCDPVKDHTSSLPLFSPSCCSLHPLPGKMGAPSCLVGYESPLNMLPAVAAKT